jgi:LPS-assembly protein
MRNNAFIVASLFTFTLLYSSSRIEINAQDINSSHQKLEASTDVVAFVNESMIKAIHATYDKNSTEMLLRGDVDVVEYEGKNIVADEIYINSTAKSSYYQTPFIVTQEDFWLYSDKIQRKENHYTFGKSILSSCNIKNPDWIMGVERSKYDANSSKMRLYHAKVYVGDVPILYFPYLSFSTKQERSSGLLFPLLSYNQNDGFIYEQPLYIAPFANWDLELNPQLRSKRSKGIYGTLRFKDTANSYGSLRLGYFEDQATYIQSNNLKNDTHYGLQFLYDSSDLLGSLKPKGFKDGLYTNITLLNDIDYLNLQKEQMISLLGANSYIRESRINYFLHNDHYYFGLYGKYFIDTRKSNNNDTIQELPTLHLHKSTASLYSNLLYSLDLKSYNYYRKEGVRAKKVDFFLPLSYTKTFLNHYLTVEISQNIYASKVYFTSSDDDRLDDYKYLSTYTQVELSSELTQVYKDYIHTVRPFVQYLKPTKSDESSVEYENLVDEAKELFSIEEIESSVVLGLSHYLYQKSGRLRFYHRLLYYYYLDRQEKLGDIRNEIGYNGDTFTIYNNLIYSQERKKIKSSLTSVGFRQGDLYIGGSYYYSDNFLLTKTKSFGVNFRYRFNERLDILGGMSYDLEKNYKTQWQLGFKYDRDCWSLSVLVKEDIQPILTTAGADAQENMSFTFEFNIVPFGGVGSN